MIDDSRPGATSAVVTGAAAGIGRAVAQTLLQQGYVVVGLDVDADGLTGAGRALGERFVPVTGDVRLRRDHERARDAAVDLAPLGAWVNNAGVERPTRAVDLDETTMRTILDVNLVGTLLGCAVATETMRAAGGVIVNMASIHSLVGFPSSFVYAATKGAIDALTRQLAVDEARHGIRVCAVRPGTVRTPLTQSFLDAADDPAALEAEYADLQLSGRLIEPAEVAAVVGFLVSPAAGSITGESVTVDGGATARCYPYPTA